MVDRFCQECGALLTLRQKRFCSVKCNTTHRNPRLMTDDVKLKISLSLAGRPSPHRGLTHSDTSRLNMSLAHLGKPSPLKGVKTGKTAWNRDVPHNDETKLKISETRQSQNIPGTNGGYTGGITPPQRVLLDILEEHGWIAEYSIGLGPRKDGYPSKYRVDIGHPQKKLAIEVDGIKHRLFKQRELDRKKSERIALLGWVTARITNERALELKGVPADQILKELFGDLI